MSILDVTTNRRSHRKRAAYTPAEEESACAPSREEGSLMELSGKLLGFLSKCSDNAAISPSCLYGTLAMVSEVTATDTREQIIDVLGSDEECAATMSGISEIPSPEYGCEDFDYATGSSLWVSEGVALSPNITKRKISMPVEIEKVRMGTDDADKAIEQWLAVHTGGMFSESPKTEPGEVLLGLGAMHLKDSWMDSFEDDDVREFAFEGSASHRIPFMISWDDYDLLEQEGSLTFSKHLTSGAYMVVSLPGRGVTLSEYAVGDAWRNISAFMRGARTERDRECKVHMPRFSIASDGVDIRGAVESLGITRIFAPDANFSPLSPGQLMTDSIQQSTRLEIDEEGLEGASYVEILLCLGLPPENPPEPREIFVDRPFAVAVATPDGLPLFVGLARKPEED